MQLHHYLPASFLANFSKDVTLPRRERKLAVLNIATQKTFISRAENLAAENDLYKLSSPGHIPNKLEANWHYYEASLPDALEHLVRGRIDALEWAAKLVPLVTGMLLRGPDFNERFEDRPVVKAVTPVIEYNDNTNMARVIEMQRLLAPVLTAEWTLAAIPDKRQLAINDLGYVPLWDLETPRVGMAVPIDRSHVLILSIRKSGPIAVDGSGTWRPLIRYVELSDDEFSRVSVAIRSFARRFVFGPDIETVMEFLPTGNDAQLEVPEPQLFGFPAGRFAALHQYTWHRVVPALTKPIDEIGSNDFPLDWMALRNALGATPATMIPLGWSPPCPPPLSYNGSTIRFDLCDVCGPTLPVNQYVELDWSQLESSTEYRSVLEKWALGIGD